MINIIKSVKNLFYKKEENPDNLKKPSVAMKLHDQIHAPNPNSPTEIAKKVTKLDPGKQYEFIIELLKKSEKTHAKEVIKHLKDNNSENFLRDVIGNYLKSGELKDIETAKLIAEKMDLLDYFYLSCISKVILFSFNKNLEKVKNFFRSLPLKRKEDALERLWNSGKKEMVKTLCVNDINGIKISTKLYHKMKDSLTKEDKNLLLVQIQKEKIFGT
jgi:hypothetical protein